MRIFTSTWVAVVAILLLAGVCNHAIGQQTLKQQLVGSWTVTSARNFKPDGTTEDIYGPRGIGIFIFDEHGRFAIVLVNPDIPRFASNNRRVATPAEFAAAYKGSFASFGRYSVSEPDRTFTFHMEGSTFPNFNGIDQKRIIKALTEDELNFVSPTPPIGGISEFRLRRVK